MSREDIIRALLDEEGIYDKDARKERAKELRKQLKEMEEAKLLEEFKEFISNSVKQVLVEHAKKYRTRQKNLHRAIKILEKTRNE